MNSAQLLKNQVRGTFRNRLLAWYETNGRDLPWRRTNDPYQIWVSEIMLQQTRVAAVLDHYRRFVDRFPNLGALARAREQTVLAAWSGLGYYRRARNLHAAAKVVVRQHGGNFPTTAASLRELPGIGRYTSAAIASIAYGECAAVVDGNVERVLRRVTGSQLSNRETWDLAEALLSPRRPGDFNQAMMELGATVCLPREPKCVACPIRRFCKTQGAPSPNESKPRKMAPIAYSLAHRNGSVWLVQRPQDSGLMAGMWELPQIVHPEDKLPMARMKHAILDTTYDVQIFEAEEGAREGRWIKRARLPRLALTGLARKVLHRLALL
jgi:A/G-specific adenine glycosylase